MSLFERRVEFKPFEYPSVEDYKRAIEHSYWLVTEWNFQSDIQDFHTGLSGEEQKIVQRTLLAISQVEVAVKRFWGDIGKTLPKPEIEQVGATFAESEVRHADAYSHLLHVLGLNEAFREVAQVPCFQLRIDYLRQNTIHSDKLSFVSALAFFSSMVENVSLFAQFAIIKSFNKERAVLKDVDNVVQATQKEETVHAMFGQWLVRQILTENPELRFHVEGRIKGLAMKALEVEKQILQWIFEDGELPFLPISSLMEFIKLRVSESLEAMGCGRLFDVNEDRLKPLKWFIEELHADVHVDFFHKRPVTYAKKTQPIKAGDLF